MISYGYNLFEKAHTCFYCNNVFQAKFKIISKVSSGNFIINDSVVSEPTVFISKDEVKSNCKCPVCHNLNEVSFVLK